MPWIDSLNVEQYVGKVVDQKPPRFFSYLPLKIVRTPSGYGVCDRNGVVIERDFCKDPIWYDKILGEALKNGKGD